MRHLAKTIEHNKRRVEEKVDYLLKTTNAGFSNAEEVLTLLREKINILKKEHEDQFDLIFRELAELKAETDMRLRVLEADSHASLSARVKHALHLGKRMPTHPTPPPESSAAPPEPSG
jgi:hypothetical protein